MTDFNLEYYRAFYYVAQYGSISKAADALFLSQPAVTRSIQKLEEELHCALFTRTKGMQLTHEGTVLFEQVRTAFDALATGEKELMRLTNYESGTLEVMGTETALYCFLIPKVITFRRQYPQTTVRITDRSTAETISAVRSGAIDVGVAVSPLEYSDDLTIRKVMEYRDIFIGGGAFSGLRGRVISTGEIAGLPFVGVDQSANEHRHLEQWFVEQGIRFEPEYMVRTSTMVIPFVEGGLAVSVLPEPLMREFIKAGKVFEIRTEKEMPLRQIYLVHRRNSPPSMLCRRFVEYLE